MLMLWRGYNYFITSGFTRTFLDDLSYEPTLVIYINFTSGLGGIKFHPMRKLTCLLVITYTSMLAQIEQINVTEIVNNEIPPIVEIDTTIEAIDTAAYYPTEILEYKNQPLEVNFEIQEDTRPRFEQFSNERPVDRLRDSDSIESNQIVGFIILLIILLSGYLLVKKIANRLSRPKMKNVSVEDLFKNQNS